MGKGQWIVWLLLLVITLAGCGTEAEVVTSEIVFEEESESEPESEAAEVESETWQAMHAKEPVSYTAESYMERRGNIDYKTTMVPFLITAKDDLETPSFVTDDFSLLASEHWEKASYDGCEVTYRALCEARYDDTFFETHDLLLLPNTTSTLSPHPTIGNFQYDPIAKRYELYVHSNDTGFASDAVGEFLHIIEIEKGLLDGNLDEILQISWIHSRFAAFYADYTPDGKNGVMIEFWFDNWRPLSKEGEGEYGLYLTLEDKSVKIAWFPEGFQPEPAAYIQEDTLTDGRRVSIGYDEEDNWIWIDFQDPTGCYGAVNRGMGSYLLHDLLNAKLGPREEGGRQ